MSGLWTTKDLCAYLKCCRGTAYKVGREADARIQVCPGVVRYDPEKIMDLMERRKG